MKLEGCAALVTGASAGIGREFARALADRAKALILVARRQERLDELRDELARQHPDLDITLRTVDVADKVQRVAFVEWIAREKIRVDLLINNAGLGDLGPFATSDPERVHQIIAVNIEALTALTRAIVPAMITNKRGAILNVSSSASFLPIPTFAVYAASKAYVTSFSEALRAELQGTGVTVCTLCPGPVHTEFTDVAERPGGKPATGPEAVYVSAGEVARIGLAAVEHERALVIPGFLMKLSMLLVRMMPLGILRIASRLSRRTRTV